ncbi:response regulator transcription factor [Nocardioides sp. SYSU D00065]|uniref:response regulator transcription factor n=1 Tax=Nocardioides sp. SYSU D00065 TaxID=2817378 RepID=UPI001B318B2E|nr:response regulator transcription factor [Nocardioides sp. SYSU D00065]
MTIRVALLGGDELVRRGLESMLRTLGGFELGSVKDRAHAPIDVALVETFGARADTNLQRAVADPYIRHVAVFTWNHQPALVHEVVGTGVAGYLSKSLSAAQLGRALRAIEMGEFVVAPRQPVPARSGLRTSSEVDLLTVRERETVAHIATGKSNNEIAEEMQISLNSVKSYIRSAYRKTGVQSRSQAVLWAVSHGVRAEVLDRA